MNSDLVTEAPYVVGSRRSPRRIPGDGVDHGTNPYKPPPRAFGGLEFSLHEYIGRYFFVTADISNTGDPLKLAFKLRGSVPMSYGLIGATP